MNLDDIRKKHSTPTETAHGTEPDDAPTQISHGEPSGYVTGSGNLYWCDICEWSLGASHRHFERDTLGKPIVGYRNIEGEGA